MFFIELRTTNYNLADQGLYLLTDFPTYNLPPLINTVRQNKSMLWCALANFRRGLTETQHVHIK